MADEVDKPVPEGLSKAGKLEAQQMADKIRAQNEACGIKDGPLLDIVNGCVTERSPNAMKVRTPASLLGGVRG